MIWQKWTTNGLTFGLSQQNLNGWSWLLEIDMWWLRGKVGMMDEVGGLTHEGRQEALYKMS